MSYWVILFDAVIAISGISATSWRVSLKQWHQCSNPGSDHEFSCQPPTSYISFKPTFSKQCKKLMTVLVQNKVQEEKKLRSLRLTCYILLPPQNELWVQSCETANECYLSSHLTNIVGLQVTRYTKNLLRTCSWNWPKNVVTLHMNLSSAARRIEVAAPIDLSQQAKLLSN